MAECGILSIREEKDISTGGNELSYQFNFMMCTYFEPCCKTKHVNDIGHVQNGVACLLLFCGRNTALK